jgi:hypothetical protein
MIYLTGDIHGHHSINKLASSNWPQGKSLTKKDYLIILGDFGLIWKNEPDANELYWTEWLSDKPWTTLVVPGNHENYDRIYDLEIIQKYGAPIRKYNNSIFLMERGEIYNIDNTTIFNMGGAHSIDRSDRILNKSWWESEIPSQQEFENGLNNLEKIGWKVDYILGHTTSNYAINNMFTPTWILNDITAKFFDIVTKQTEFKKFYFGHWHQDKSFENYRALYHNIIQLGD